MADADKKKTCFSAEVFGADMARALDAFAALEVCISADTLRCGGAAATAAESVPFARPSGVSMYEADALTWRLYHTHASCVVNAINNAAYGDGLARAARAPLCLFRRAQRRAPHGGRLGRPGARGALGRAARALPLARCE